MLQIGSIVDGKYKILSEIGRGGMSVVYMAINERANKTWAIKEVRKDGVLNFEAVKQGLIVETDMLKKLRHPYLPSIVDVIDTRDSFLIVMDYIEGKSLSAALEQKGVIPQDYVIAWAKQMCDVLGYLHSRTPPIVYRDIKPANIMLKPDGNITLIDFGTAREFKEKNLEDTTCLGTMGYAAPEQFGGMGQTDGRTDIYGLGATMYHLVTGYNPSEPPYEMYPIRQINSGLSSGLEKIIGKCTQRNPEDRYQSTAELLYALEHYDAIDNDYLRKVSRKVNIFKGMCALSVLCVGISVGMNVSASHKASDRYEVLIDTADKSSDYEEKEKLYGDCIEIPNQGGNKEAYLKLINTYKENDGVFSISEANTLERYIKNHKAELVKDPEVYTEICFETGKLFWYYYEYGNDNQITRAKSSIEWFEDVKKYAPSDYLYRGMAEVYSEIGKFYKDITTHITEASDKGKYKPFYKDLKELVDTVAKDDNESEIVRLELLQMASNSLQQYATKLKIDGLKESDVMEFHNQIGAIAKEVPASVEKTKQIQREILLRQPDTEEAIQQAYHTRTGGDVVEY